MKLPRWLLFAVAILVVLSWVPLALIMRARVTTSPQPRIHIVPDMDNQPKYKAQSRNPMFADRRAMRPPVSGAVARGTILGDPALMNGKISEDWVAVIPLKVDNAALQRGRDPSDISSTRFQTASATCRPMVRRSRSRIAGPLSPT
jgi:hypothetical protein